KGPVPRTVRRANRPAEHAQSRKLPCCPDHIPAIRYATALPVSPCSKTYVYSNRFPTNRAPRLTKAPKRLITPRFRVKAAAFFRNGNRGASNQPTTANENRSAASHIAY